MVSLGLTCAQIGSRLGVTASAAKFHLASMDRKLDVANSTEAAAAHLTRETLD